MRVVATEEKLRKFLSRYLGQGELKKDHVLQEDVDHMVDAAVQFHIEQDIIDYGTEHPDAPFWDFIDVYLEKVGYGLHGVTQEELDADE